MIDLFNNFVFEYYLVVINLSEKENMKLPEQFSKESYDKILTAMFYAKAHEKPISRKDIADVTGSTPENISTALTFLKSIKAINKDGRNNKLTELGLKYAQAIKLDFLDEARKHLNKLIINNGITEKLQRYLSVNKNKTSEEIKRKIIEFSKKPINQTIESAANTFYEMLIFAGYIEDINGVILLLDTITDSTTTDKITISKTFIEKDNSEKNTNIIPVSLNINLNINLTQESKIDDLVDMIKKIKNEIEK